MKLAQRYAAEGNQTAANLVHLKDDIIVGEWRDSTYGRDDFLPCSSYETSQSSCYNSSALIHIFLQ